MTKILTYDGVDEYVMKYIDTDGRPCTWIGTEAGLLQSEGQIKLLSKVKIQKND